MIRLAETDDAVGDPVLTEAELDVYVRAFQASGFGPGIHWYRNVDRNWHLLGEVDPVVHQPALMIYGDRDTVMQAPRLQTFVPNVEVRHLDCGHWIQEELPEQTNALLLQWLDHQGASPQIPLAGNSTARVERARADASRG
jgi:pimeloyl-ACP methyl ester carboxylesterase